MASTYPMVAYGSSGSAVKELQEALNRHGYDLAVDGIFGEKTKAAVRSYQKKNGLKLDGIAGNETWGSLRNSAASMEEMAPPAPAVSPNTSAALENWSRALPPVPTRRRPSSTPRASMPSSPRNMNPPSTSSLPPSMRR